MNTDEAIMLCQWKTTSLTSNKWINTLNIKEVVWTSVYWMLEEMYCYYKTVTRLNTNQFKEFVIRPIERLEESWNVK